MVQIGNEWAMRQNVTGWQPIATAPHMENILLAAYIVPSEEAARNGSKPFWDFGIGSHIYGHSFTGVLSGTPSHWMPLPKPPEATGQ